MLVLQPDYVVHGVVKRKMVSENAVFGECKMLKKINDKPFQVISLTYFTIIVVIGKH